MNILRYYIDSFYDYQEIFNSQKNLIHPSFFRLIQNAGWETGVSAFSKMIMHYEAISSAQPLVWHLSSD